jgi:hypothetical protein
MLINQISNVFLIDETAASSSDQTDNDRASNIKPPVSSTIPAFYLTNEIL